MRKKTISLEQRQAAMRARIVAEAERAERHRLIRLRQAEEAAALAVPPVVPLPPAPALPPTTADEAWLASWRASLKRC